jgi:hypothetical protein
MKMPIFYNLVKYQVRHYGKKKGQTVLKEKHSEHSSKEVSIGDTIELLNNPIYNNNMLNRLKLKHGKRMGCEVKVIDVAPITQCGYSNDRFK